MAKGRKKGEVILREPGGTFSPQLSAAGGRLTRRFDLRYFKAAKDSLNPEQFGELVKELYRLALKADEDCDRIRASKALLQVFLPKDWHAQWANALEEESADGAASEARPTPRLLEAVEEVVLQAREKRTREARA